jgi:hypothetical protein
MDASLQKVVLLSALGYTAYSVAVCPCGQIGSCKRAEFLALASVPMAFALYNYIAPTSCGQ